MKVKVRVKKAEVKAEEVGITSEFIKLDAFLKFAVIAETGGEAKAMVQDGEIKVNGETCLQRGKKLRPGDSVEAFGKKYVVTVMDEEYAY